MTVTELKIRRKNLTAVCFDCEICPGDFGAETDPVGLPAIDTDVCTSFGLKVGDEISEERFGEIVAESNRKRAVSSALWYLSRKSMSRAGLVSKLKPRFGEAAANTAADRMEELRFLNDADYAERRMELILQNKKVSKRMAVQLLLAEGIDRETADAAADGADYDPDGALSYLIEHKYKNKLSDKKDRDRTVAALMRKGYSYGEIKRALEKYTDTEEMSEEF